MDRNGAFKIMTPERLDIDLPHLEVPPKGFQEGVYIVDVAWSETNVIHRAVLWISTLRQKPDPTSNYAKSFPEMHAREVKAWDVSHGIDHPNNWIHGQYDQAMSLQDNRPVYLKPLVYLGDANKEINVEFFATPHDSVVTPHEFAKRLSVPLKTLQKMEDKGTVPARRKIEGQTVEGWMSSEIDHWLANRHVIEENRKSSN